MRIVPRIIYKKLISALMTVMLVLTLALVIATVVVGVKPDLVVKEGLGTFDRKNKVYTPDFDDIDVKRIYEGDSNVEKSMGLYYSDIFKNADKSLTKFYFKSDNPKAKNFLPLDTSITRITLQHKTKNTFNKKKDYTITINWRNLLFVKNEDLKDICAVKKSRLKERPEFATLEEAYNARLERRDDTSTEPPIDFSKYYLAAGYSKDKEPTPLFPNSSVAKFGIKDSENRDFAIDNAEYLKIVNGSKSSKSKFPIFTFEVRDEEKTLIKFEETSGNYKIPENDPEGITYSKWGKANKLLKTFEDGDYEPLMKGVSYQVDGPTYLYAFIKTVRRRINVDVRYEFEGVDDKYETDKQFAKLEKSLLTLHSRETETFSVRRFDAYNENRDERLKMSYESDWNKNKVGYERVYKVFYTSGKNSDEREATHSNILDDGSDTYTVIFRYSRKSYKLVFRDHNDNAINHTELGLEKNVFKFNERVNINPYSFKDEKVFSHWEVVRRIGGKDTIPETFNGGLYTLDVDHVSENAQIRFKAMPESDNTKKKVIFKYYKETNNSNEFEESHTKIFTSGFDYTFTYDEKITDLANMINGNKGALSNLKYNQTPKVIDERQNKVITDLSNVKFNKHDFMLFKVLYSKSRDIIRFNESKSGNGLLRGDQFTSLFKKEVEVKYGELASDALGEKNKLGVEYTFKEGNETIGNIKLLGWKPINSFDQEFCNAEGYFDLETYKNTHDSDNKKTIDLYPVWDQEVVLYVNTYLSDSRRGDREVNVNGANKKYRLSYSYQFRYKYNFFSELSFSNEELKERIKNEIKDDIRNNVSEQLLYSNFDKVFNFDGIEKDIKGNTKLQFKTDEKNVFNLYVNRHESKIEYQLNFNYTDYNVGENVDYLRMNDGVQKEDFERKGLGQLGYNIPDTRKFSEPQEVTDRGEHPINLKNEISNLDKPKELIGKDSVYEADSYTVRNSDGHQISSGLVEGLVDQEVHYNRGVKITINYKPKEYNIAYKHDEQTTLQNAPSVGRYLHKITLETPQRGDSKFIGWRYSSGKDISSALIKYNYAGKKIVSSEYIMPASDVTLEPVFGLAEFTRVHTIIKAQDENGNFKSYSHKAYLPGKYTGYGILGEYGDYYKKGETDESKKPDITDYTEANYIPNLDYSPLYLDEDNLAREIPGVGRIEHGSDNRYRLSIDLGYQGSDVEVEITFKRYELDVNFRVKSAHSSAEMHPIGLPATTKVYVGGKLPFGNYDAAKMSVDINGKSYDAPFRGYSLDDDDDSAEVKRDAKDFVFDKDTYKAHGRSATLYARWHAIQNVHIYAQLQFETVGGGFYEYVTGLKEFELTEKVNLPFDGQAGTAVEVNNMRMDISSQVLAKGEVARPYVASPEEIEYAGTNPYELILGKNILYYRLKRKRVRVMFNLPPGTTPSTIAEQEVIFGNKMQPSVLPQTYKASNWEGTTIATFKHFTRNPIDYINNYSENKVKFDIANRIFDQDEDFITNVMNLYPVWNKANNVPIKLRVYGETSARETEIEDKAEGMNELYTTTTVRTDGTTVRPADLVSYLRSVLNTQVYNENNFVFKHNGLEIELSSDAMVTLTSTTSNLTFEVYLKRKLRTITLQAGDSDIINADEIVGAVEKGANNKTLKFKHGYKFADDEKAYVLDNVDYEFMGWKREGVPYVFDTSKEVIEDFTLIADMQMKYAIANVALNGIRARGLEYSDLGINGELADDLTKITVKVPHDRLPYRFDTSKLLRAEAGANFYSEVSQRRVKQTGYSGDVDITERGKTYNIGVNFEEETDLIYKGFYPQTEFNLTGSINVKSKITVNLKYGSVDVVNAYNKGDYYEELTVEENGETVKKYFRYEPLAMEQVPGNPNQEWTKNHVDLAHYDNGALGSSHYDSPYIEQYLRKVFKIKMQLSSSDIVELPKIRGYSDIEGEESINDLAGAMRFNAISNFTTESCKNYRLLRKIGFGDINISFTNATWLGIIKSSATHGVWMLYPDGTVHFRNTYYAFGLRPVIRLS